MSEDCSASRSATERCSFSDSASEASRTMVMFLATCCAVSESPRTSSSRASSASATFFGPGPIPSMQEDAIASERSRNRETSPGS